MPLPEPRFDTRTYQELLGEAVARIPVHNPEWTNFNASDPGITILQLFAFLAESIIYRANRIPTRNRQKFLRLLGIPLEPPRPARGIIAFSTAEGSPVDGVEVAEGTEVRAGNTPFRLLNGLLVLPVETRMFYKEPVGEPRRSEIQEVYNRLYASIRRPFQNLVFYEAKQFLPPGAGALVPSLRLGDTVDHSLWLALLARTPEETDEARRAIAGKIATFGLVPALDATGKALYPAGPPGAIDRPRLIFELPDLSAGDPRYKPIASADDLLARPGVVQVQLPPIEGLATWQDLGPLEAGVAGYPPAIDDSSVLDRLITWIRVRAPKVQGADTGAGGQIDAALSWVGINAAEVLQSARVQGERLPDGTGEPNQTAQLANAPVIWDSVRLTVNGEPWARVDSLSGAAPEVPSRAPRFAEPRAAPGPEREHSKVFVVDHESGEIMFGDGVRFGVRPPRNAIVLADYEHGGGLAGQVGIGLINRPPDRLPTLTVSNPVPTWGATAGETVAQAEARIPAIIRHRDLLGTCADYKEISEATPGVDIGRVEVLPLVHPDFPGQESEGVVTILVVPRTDSRQPEAPQPDRLFLETVCAHLAPRRILTTELHVRGPQYVPIGIGIGIDSVPGEAEALVVERVRRAVLDFLSPLKGGFELKGWPLGKAVDPLEIQAAASRVEGVARVIGSVLTNGDLNPVGEVPITGLQLPRVVALGVAEGEPPSITSAPPPADEPPALPVPVAPDEC